VSTARRILLASYHFPPGAAVGGLRVAKFARLLPQAGWEPHVLTIKDHLRGEDLDAGRLEGLEHVPVVRTGELPRAIEAVGRIKSTLRRRRSPRNASPAAPATSATTARRETIERRLTRYVVSLLWSLPDAQKNWALAAAPAAVRLIRRHRIDWVFTSGPPFSTHVIGLAAKLLTGARWIADFRDPWIEILSERREDARSLASDRIEQWMETSVARVADRIVTTTEPLRAAMAARYQWLPSDKFVCIPNGIDASIAGASRGPDRFDVFTITYAGSFYYDRTPEPLFRAVSRMISAGRASRHDVRIKLVGDCREIDGTATESLIGRYGLEGVVELIDRVPHAEAVRIMQRSHLLLVLAPERHRLVIPAKIFDYLGTGVAVLALAPPGATAALVAETQCGRCFSDSDVSGIEDYLSALLADGSFRRLGNDSTSLSQYELRHVVQRLAAELDLAGREPVTEVAARA
jgi:glycosyltransferase involved in cell wall biosynthesis